MIRYLATILTILSVVGIAAQAPAQTKVDPFLNDVTVETGVTKALSIAKAPESTFTPVEVFVQSTNPEETADAIRAVDGAVRTIVGKVMTASLPPSAISAIAERSEVLFVEAAKPVSAYNDVAMPEIGVPEVHQGLSLPVGYTGKNVIVGIVDTGIDYHHEDFNDAEGKSRILAVWDQNRIGGKGPSEISDTYGTECDATMIANGTCALVDAEGHGTHVSGIAAGRHDQYSGVAPDANIIMVRYDSSLRLDNGYAEPLFSTKICDAAAYIFAKARARNMPAVVNLSLGTHIGAHDGSSLFEQCLAGLTANTAGRAIVAAAGNEYSTESTFTGIHTGFELKDRTTAASNFVIRTATRDLIYYIDLWAATGSELSIRLAIHKGTPAGSPLEISSPAPFGEKVDGSFLGGKIKYIINATETASALNGKPHAGIRILLDSSVSSPADYSFDLIVSGTGSFDAWLFPDKPSRTIQFTSIAGNRGGDYAYIPGDREKNIAIPSTSPSILSVAGYATRTRWDAGGQTWVFNGQELGSILKFSSSGPSANPEATGQKPEIAAPGGMIAAPLSTKASVGSQVLTSDGKHFLQAGTSMAAPFVSGTIALMFEANRNFTQKDITDFLIKSAYADSSVGSVPNNRWGHGKLDTLAALEVAVNGSASGKFDDSPTAAPADPATTGSSGKAGCELAPGGTTMTTANLMLFAVMFIPLLVLMRSRRRRRVYVRYRR